MDDFGQLKAKKRSTPLCTNRELKKRRRLRLRQRPKIIIALVKEEKNHARTHGTHSNTYFCVSLRTDNVVISTGGFDDNMRKQMRAFRSLFFFPSET